MGADDAAAAQAGMAGVAAVDEVAPEGDAVPEAHVVLDHRGLADDEAEPVVDPDPPPDPGLRPDVGPEGAQEMPLQRQGGGGQPVAEDRMGEPVAEQRVQAVGEEERRDPAARIGVAPRDRRHVLGGDRPEGAGEMPAGDGARRPARRALGDGAGQDLGEEGRVVVERAGIVAEQVPERGLPPHEGGAGRAERAIVHDRPPLVRASGPRGGRWRPRPPRGAKKASRRSTPVVRPGSIRPTRGAAVLAAATRGLSRRGGGSGRRRRPIRYRCRTARRRRRRRSSSRRRARCGTPSRSGRGRHRRGPASRGRGS